MRVPERAGKRFEATNGMPPGHPLAGRGTTSALPGDKTASEPLTAKVQVSEAKIRVLLVDGSPRYEWRYLFTMLGREPTIELHTLLARGRH